MSEIKNSRLLEDIIQYAKTYGCNTPSTLTAERFLLSVIDVIFGKAPVSIGDTERSKLVDILTDSFPEDYCFENIKKSLETNIAEKKESSFIYIQQRIYEAKGVAKKNGMDELPPELLLTCILGTPNDFLKANIKSHGNNVAGSTEKVTVDTASWLKPDAEKDPVLPRDATRINERKNEEKQAETEPEDKEDPRVTVAKLTEKTKRIQKMLHQHVFGQDNAISVFASGYFRAELLSMTDKNRARPKATFLFAGPPGVGKTFLAKKAAEVLRLPFHCFDMSEYSDSVSDIEFFGFDNVYKNGQEGNVTSFVARNPKCVVLFDEIEKAHINIIHLFLQILDAGHIRDNYTDKEVSFADAILIFTTNAGKQLYEDSDSTDFSGVSRKVILKALQNDTDPKTGTPYFPAAICSRFASGNVVMFNYMTAHNLREIAKREIMRQASNFEKEVGIRVQIDERVYSALLFAEGGSTDARTIQSRAESFFDDELFELFRLLDSARFDDGIEKLEEIRIGVELPKEDKAICGLFERSGSLEVLTFAPQSEFELCAGLCPEIRFFNAQSVDEAKRIMKTRDISFVIVDITFGRQGEGIYLNIEDEDSAARDFFWFSKETHPGVPIYLLQTPDRRLNDEEKRSFLRQGVRGVITLFDSGDRFSSEIKEIGAQLHQQKSVESLAKANKLVSFETAQSLKDDGKTAEITLFDFEMEVAVDAEDSGKILGNLSKPNVSFEQVIGAEEAKKELRYFVDYLKNPKKYLGTGVSAPKGVLLYGPPGTGKTMLAKAMASESDVTFITAEGNQFVNKYQGEGRDRVKDLFRTARKYAPTILFIDEIDAIAKERRGGENSGDIEITLTALLTEMDGFKNDTAKPVFVLAATNFDVEPGSDKSLDPALMRRFDRRVFIDLPTKEERVRFMHLKIDGKPTFELTEDKISNIAVRSTGMSLAGLESVFELSLRAAIRDGKFKVTDEIFEEAFETFNGGEAKKWDASQLERVARHEAGHAFLCWHSGETPSYVTIVARGDHGGYMQHDDNEGKAIYTRDELLAKIRTSLGGRAAEIVYYGEKDGVSTGASGDLTSATNIARSIICTYGMDRELGLAVIDQQESRTGESASVIRKAVNKILDGEMQIAIRLIEENRCVIDELVERLLSENHLTGSEISAIFGKSGC